ncbi:MAG: hypothetical protein GC181_00355 [Bacteroidetes bacterium]|nr:hypothetical protein [Bacteroidota bacterium]
MKKVLGHRACLLITVSSISAIFSSCNTHCRQTRRYVANVPVYESLTDIRNSIKIQSSVSLENPGKINQYGDLLFIIEKEKGIHVVDNSNPSSPVFKKFISMHACHDIATGNGLLYVDQGPDIVAFDISDIDQIQVVGRSEKVIFSDQLKGDSFPVSFIEKEIEEVIDNGDCGGSNGRIFEDFVAVPEMSGGGTSGSTSRMIFDNNRLFVVDNSTIFFFDLANPHKPVKVSSQIITNGLETVYLHQDLFFIGSQFGMFIMKIQNQQLQQVSGVFHSRGCDPVVVQNNRAYVTLRGSNTCGSALNSLEVIDISNPTSPNVIAQHFLTEPFGLAVKDSLLVICDGSGGVRIFDSRNDLAILQNQFSVCQVGNAFDVILSGKRMLVTSDKGIFQFDISDPKKPDQISTLFSK